MLHLIIVKKCDGYFHSFFTGYRLSFRHGGIIITCNDDVHDEILCLAWQSFYLKYVLDKPLIHQGCSTSEEEVRQGKGGLETRGRTSFDLMGKSD